MTDLWGLSAIGAKFALYLGLLTATGTVFAALVFQIPVQRRAVAGFAALGIAASALGFMLSGAALTGDLGGMVDAEMLGLLWTTPVGTALVWRLIGLAALIAGLWMGRAGVWVSAAGGAMALWSFGTVGHVQDRDLPWLNALLMYHLAAIALWIGILSPLRRLALDSTPHHAATLGSHFGRLASVFVPLLIIAGGVMAYVLLGSRAALFGTGYGQALLLKTGLVAGLLSLAALNKTRFVPRLKVGEAAAAALLARSIRIEWGAVIAILMTSAVLTSNLTLP